MRKRVVGLVAIAALLTPATAAAEIFILSPGIKVGYTFGQGFTWGLELTAVWVGDPGGGLGVSDLLKDAFSIGWGVALNVDWVVGADLAKLRLGGQWTGPGFGLETGPGVVWDGDKSYFAWGISAFAATWLIPYYSYSLVFGREGNLHELGLYGKLHLCIYSSSECYSGDSDFD